MRRLIPAPQITCWFFRSPACEQNGDAFRISPLVASYRGIITPNPRGIGITGTADMPQERCRARDGRCPLLLVRIYLHALDGELMSHRLLLEPYSGFRCIRHCWLPASQLAAPMERLRSKDFDKTTERSRQDTHPVVRAAAPTGVRKGVYTKNQL